jgi:hypothetical protein
LFLLVGSQLAQAGVVVSGNTIVVNQGNGNTAIAKASFETLTDQKPGSTTAPAFDINTGTLVFNGGSLDATPNGTSTITGAFIDYFVYDPDGNTLTSGSVTLPQTGTNGATRTFSLSTANVSIIPFIATEGTGYSIQIGYRVTYRNTGSTVIQTSRDEGYAATFDVVGVRAPAPTINPSNIQLAIDTTANVALATTYYFPNTGTSPQFPGATIASSKNAGGVSGAFNINNGQLRLVNTTVTTTEAGANTVSSVVLYYRVRSTSSGGGAFQAITLSQSGTTNNGARTFIIDPNNTTNSNPQANLIAAAAVTTTGTYAIDVYYQASGVNSSTGTPFTIVYPPTGYSTATFVVGGTPIALTIWTGAVNDNWFDPNNWTNGIPTRTTNALVRDLGAGDNVPYPNIRSDMRYTTTSGQLIYDNSNTGPAEAFNFTMGGSSQAARSIARLVNGQLRVFGTFDNSYDSFIQRENTIMEFAGTNQTITGGSFVRVDISGGGTKTLGVLTGLQKPRSTGQMIISESLNFMTPNVYATVNNPLAPNPYTTLTPSAGILTTDITSPTTNLVSLADRATINYNNGAQLNGETDLSYVYGFVRTTRQDVAVNENRSYGNIGMNLTFTGVNDPNNVEVTRNTVESYTPLANAFGIRRIFGVRPSNQTTNNGGLIATMVFHYRNSETKRLNGPNTQTYGTGIIPEQDLTIFVSSNSGNTFSLVGRDALPDTVNNTVTRTGVRSFATLTLGDVNHPLPVSLVAFDAKRVGGNTQLSWATATETDNSGFEVQVSTDGTTFSKLTFVASKSPTSLVLQTYSYLDTEANKSGTRYYRLRQIDISGKEWYSPVRTVSFSGNAEVAQTSLTAYPNPFVDGDQLKLVVQATTGGSAHLQVTDVMGREVSKQDFSTIAGIQEVSIPESTGFSAGIYVAKITLATGEVKTLRIQKR